MKTQTFSMIGSVWNNLNLTILDHGLFAGDRNWNHPDKLSPFNRLYFIIDGDGYLSTEAEHLELKPGLMYLIPAGLKFSYGCASTIDKFYLHFNLELLAGVDLFSQLHSFCSLPCPRQLLDAILANAEKESLLGLLQLKSLLWNIIFRFFEQSIDESGYLEHFKGFYQQKEVLGYLSKHLCASLRISELADALGTSPHLLSRSFRQDTGLGLKEYMEYLLLQKARHLLLHTNLPINQISEQLGFCDPYYFSRFFKKQELLSPREYRRQGF